MQRRTAPQQCAHPLAAPNPQAPQRIGAAVGLLQQRLVAQVLTAAVAMHETHGKLCPEARQHLPVQRLVGHVQSAAR